MSLNSKWEQGFTLLQGLFPEVDSRILKATMFEHGDDLDAAKDFIVNEVLAVCNLPPLGQVVIAPSDTTMGNEIPSCPSGLEANDNSIDENVGDPLPQKEIQPCESIPEAELTLSSFHEDGSKWGSMSLSSFSTSSVNMETLDDAVAEARNDKELLLNALEGVQLLQGKAEQEEAAVLRAKADACIAGLDILARAEELKESLIQAQQANEIHAGELCGEKAILATEARELQSRLVQVKQEREKIKTTLDEICALLQSRYNAAIQEREIAEDEKKQKEAEAQMVLATQEALMAKVTQESRDLEAEAESCSQLRDFLINRGGVVDSLQGEIAVLHEDVEALKNQLKEGTLSTSIGYINVTNRYRFPRSSKSSLESSSRLTDLSMKSDDRTASIIATSSSSLAMAMGDYLGYECTSKVAPLSETSKEGSLHKSIGSLLDYPSVRQCPTLDLCGSAIEVCSNSGFFLESPTEKCGEEMFNLEVRKNSGRERPLLSSSSSSSSSPSSSPSSSGIEEKKTTFNGLLLQESCSTTQWDNDSWDMLDVPLSPSSSSSSFHRIQR